MNDREFEALVGYLCGLPNETEWVEFKRNRFDAEEVGRLLSGLANSAALHEQEVAYLVYGVQDYDHDIVGTNVDPKMEYVGAEEFEAWLARLMNPRIDFRIHKGSIYGKKVVLFEIEPATNYVVRFMSTAYIRINSITKPLSEYPGKEKRLWQILSTRTFEVQTAKRGLTPDEVLALIDYSTYFRRLRIELPSTKEGIIDKLVQEGLAKYVNGMLAVTNLGAILFAHDLTQFEFLRKKMPRVIVYDGKNKSRTKRDQTIARGYAVDADSMVELIASQLPTVEYYGAADKELRSVYPPKALRELILNALIHQDFSISGASPMIEVYDDRIEITNPGKPLIDTRRFLDAEPQSRNEKLAGLMRRARICEEKGSGVDNAVIECEIAHLPAPTFQADEEFTRVVMYGPHTLREMDTTEKINTTYLHACLKRVSNESMNNESVRERFGIEQHNYAQASRIIKMALEAGAIKEKDPKSNSKKYATYLPYWA